MSFYWQTSNGGSLVPIIFFFLFCFLVDWFLLFFEYKHSNTSDFCPVWWKESLPTKRSLTIVAMVTKIRRLASARVAEDEKQLKLTHCWWEWPQLDLIKTRYTDIWEKRKWVIALNSLVKEKRFWTEHIIIGTKINN